MLPRFLISEMVSIITLLFPDLSERVYLCSSSALFIDFSS